MHLELVTPPATEPLSLAEAKLHCRVDVTDDDAWFTDAIAAARRAAETYADRAFVTQTWRQTWDAFPAACSGAPLLLAKNPLASVTSLKYIDTQGAEQTLDALLYTVDTFAEPARIVPAYGQSWPATRAVPNAVTVQYVAGVADASVDPRVKMAVRMLVAHWYENRETVAVGSITKEIEFSFKNLLAQIWNGAL